MKPTPSEITYTWVINMIKQAIETAEMNNMPRPRVMRLGRKIARQVREVVSPMCTFKDDSVCAPAMAQGEEWIATVDGVVLVGEVE